MVEELDSVEVRHLGRCVIFDTPIINIVNMSIIPGCRQAGILKASLITQHQQSIFKSIHKFKINCSVQIY